MRTIKIARLDMIRIDFSLFAKNMNCALELSILEIDFTIDLATR